MMRTFSSWTIVFGALILMPSEGTPLVPLITRPSMWTMRPTCVPASSMITMFGPFTLVDITPPMIRTLRPPRMKSGPSFFTAGILRM